MLVVHCTMNSYLRFNGMSQWLLKRDLTFCIHNSSFLSNSKPTAFIFMNISVVQAGEAASHLESD